MQSNFLTAHQVATEYFNGTLSYKNVLWLTREGYLPAIRQGKKYVYHIPALDLWTRRNFNTPAFAKFRSI